MGNFTNSAQARVAMLIKYQNLTWKQMLVSIKSSDT